MSYLRYPEYIQVYFQERYNEHPSIDRFVYDLILRNWLGDLPEEGLGLRNQLEFPFLGN